MSANVFAREALENAAANGAQNGNINLNKIRLGSKLHEVSQALEEVKAKVDQNLEKCLTKLQPICDDSENPNQATAIESQAEAKTLHAAATKYIQEEVKKGIVEAKDRIEMMTTMQEVPEAKLQITEVRKTFHVGPMSDFATYVKRLNFLFASLSRKTAPAAKRVEKEKTERPKPPLYSSLFGGMHEATLINITSSVYEAKGGVRATGLKSSTPEAYNQLGKAAVIKRSLNKVNQALKRGLGSCADTISAGKRIEKMLDQLVTVAFGSDTRSQRALPKADWAHRVFAFSVYGSGPCTAEVNWPDFGMMQAQIVLAGDVVYAGVPSGRVPGTTFAEKRANVMRMTVDDISRMVNAGGFFMKFEDGVSAEGHCGIVVHRASSSSRRRRVLGSSGGASSPTRATWPGSARPCAGCSSRSPSSGTPTPATCRSRARWG